MSNELTGVGSVRASLIRALSDPSRNVRSEAFSAIMADKLARQNEDSLSAAVSAAQQAGAANAGIYTAPVVSSYTDQPQSLLGKSVTAYALVGQPDGTASPQTITGIVQGVYLENGQAYLSVNGYQVSPANVISVNETQASAYSATNTASGSLMGRLVSVPCYDAYGNQTTMEGLVSGEFSQNGINYVTVNGLDVEASRATILQSATGAQATQQTAPLPYGVVYVPPVDPSVQMYMENVERLTMQAVNMSEDLRWLLSLIENDPALLTDGEYEVFGEPDETGAYG